MDKTFVSRGGIKLQAALEQFDTDVSGKTVLDVGSSTGGFVDCLLQNGAAKVYSVDTAYGELAWKLRQDSRVVVMERTNILYLTNLPEEVDLVTIDASWTKLVLILPVVINFLKEKGTIIALLKPHYELSSSPKGQVVKFSSNDDEANKSDLIKGVLPEERALMVKDGVIRKIRELGLGVTREIESPIKGGAGNSEFLLLIDR